MTMHASGFDLRVSIADSGFGGDRALAFACPDGVRYLFVCDVAGPAAEFLANSARMLACMGMSPGVIMQTLDLGLSHYYGGRGLFASAFLAAVDGASLTYVSAGHPDALLFGGEADGHDHLNATGPLLGVFAQPAFEVGALPMPPGTTLTIVTDGILEAPLRAGGRLGTCGFARIVAATLASASAEPAAAVIDATRRRVLRVVDDYAVLMATASG
jgi:serine phosphatase RsbU (regulator of sigma subunit)